MTALAAITLAWGALIIGVAAAPVFDRANHDNFAVGVAMVYPDGEPTRAEQVRDCQELVKALPHVDVQCVRVR